MITMKANKVWFADGNIFIALSDGRVGRLLVQSFPRLANATPEQRSRYTLSPCGIHWEELDEDLAFNGFVYDC